MNIERLDENRKFSKILRWLKEQQFGSGVLDEDPSVIREFFSALGVLRTVPSFESASGKHNDYDYRKLEAANFKVALTSFKWLLERSLYAEKPFYVFDASSYEKLKKVGILG